MKLKKCPIYDTKLTFNVSPHHWHLLRGDGEPVHRTQEGRHPIDGEEPGLVRVQKEGEVGLDLRDHFRRE